MKIESASPHPDLAHLIREIYYLEIAPHENFPPQVVVDDACHDIIFYKEQKGAVFYHGPEQNSVPLEQMVFTIHQVNPPYRLALGEGLDFFVIKMQPWANVLLFKHLEPGIHGLEEIGESMRNEVFEQPTFSQKIQLAEVFVYKLSSKKEMDASFQITRKICQEIYRKKGRLSVQELSLEFNLSRQTLNKLFKNNVGYTLKKFMMIVRIVASIKYRMQHPEISLTELGYEFAYFDQAHFNHDFQRVCGLSPRTFFQEIPIFYQRF